MALFVILLLMTLMTMNITPKKLTFLLMAFSVMMGFSVYKLSNSMFMSSSLVISFSSGMMILFAYSSILSLYEKKSMSSNLAIPLMTTMMIYSTQPNQEMINTFSMMTFNTITMLFMMMVVIISMFSINKIILNPTKKMMSSY